MSLKFPGQLPAFRFSQPAPPAPRAPASQPYINVLPTTPLPPTSSTAPRTQSQPVQRSNPVTRDQSQSASTQSEPIQRSNPVIRDQSQSTPTQSQPVQRSNPVIRDQSQSANQSRNSDATNSVKSGRGFKLSEPHTIVLFRCCVANLLSYLETGPVMSFWIRISIQLQRQIRRSYSWKSCRDRVKMHVQKREEYLAINKTGIGAEQTSELSSLIDQWIMIRNQYDLNQQLAKETRQHQEVVDNMDFLLRRFLTSNSSFQQLDTLRAASQIVTLTKNISNPSASTASGTSAPAAEERNSTSIPNPMAPTEPVAPSTPVTSSMAPPTPATSSMAPPDSVPINPTAPIPISNGDASADDPPAGGLSRGQKRTMLESLFHITSSLAKDQAQRESKWPD